MIAEPSTDTVPRPATETSKKSVLKTVNSGSVEKLIEKTLDVKITEVRSPSPIPEDPAEEEANKQSSGEKKVKEDKHGKENTEEQQIEKKGEETKGQTKLNEQQKEETVKSDDEPPQSGSVEEKKNISDDVAGKAPSSNEEKCEKKHADSAKKEISEAVILETKQQGKSIATGQVIGGWI